MGRKKPQITPNPTVFVRNQSQPEALQRQPSTLAQLEKFENIIIYGDDNALPLRIAKSVSESPAASACINTIAKYIKGAKFKDDRHMNLVVDKNGTTLWQFHCILADMIARFDGISANTKYEGSGKIRFVYPVNFESVRLKKPDDNGYIGKVTYNPYYGTSEYKKEYTNEYYVYNPRAIFNQMRESNFKGQVYYYCKTTAIHRFYSVPDYWSAKRWIEIDGKIQEFHAENLDNGFFQSVLMNVIGDPSQPSNNPEYQEEYTDDDGTKRTRSTKTVGEEFNDAMSKSFSGSSKAGTALVLWSGNVDSSVKVTNFSSTSNEALFVALQDLTTKNITIATQVPGILANISEGVNLGSTGNEMQKAVELMQSRVKGDQLILTNFYNELLKNWHETVDANVEIVDFTPITVPVEINDKVWESLSAEERREFIRKNFPSITLLTTAQTDGATTLNPNEQQPSQQVNDALKNVNLQQLDRIQKIVKRFNRYQIDPNDQKGLTYDQAKQMMLAFGFTDEQIDAWLVRNDEE